MKDFSKFSLKGDLLKRWMLHSFSKVHGEFKEANLGGGCTSFSIPIREIMLRHSSIDEGYILDLEEGLLNMWVTHIHELQNYTFELIVEEIPRITKQKMRERLQDFSKICGDVNISVSCFSEIEPDEADFELGGVPLFSTSIISVCGHVLSGSLQAKRILDNIAWISTAHDYVDAYNALYSAALDDSSAIVTSDSIRKAKEEIFSIEDNIYDFLKDNPDAQ